MFYSHFSLSCTTIFLQVAFKYISLFPWLVFLDFKQCSPTSYSISFLIFALLPLFLALRGTTLYRLKKAHLKILNLLFTTSAKPIPSPVSKNVVILSFISLLPSQTLATLWSLSVFSLLLKTAVKLISPPEVGTHYSCKLHINIANNLKSQEWPNTKVNIIKLCHCTYCFRRHNLISDKPNYENLRLFSLHLLQPT